MNYNVDSEYEEEDDDDGDDRSSESSRSSSDKPRVETAIILGEKFHLPQGLAEDGNIFKEFLSVPMWQSLSPADKTHLQKFLPTFPENDMTEKNVTLRRLFSRDNFKFGSPFTTFHNKLQNGHFRPDIAHLRNLMRKAERRHQREQEKRRAFKLLKNVIVGRRELLEGAFNNPPGVIKANKSQTVCNQNNDTVLQRVKKRYFQELSAVRSEVGQDSQSSEDENYLDGAPKLISKKQKQKLNMLEASLSGSGMTMVTSTLSTKPNGYDLESQVTSVSNPYEVTEGQYRRTLLNHFKRRMNSERHPELVTSGITLKDVAVRTQFGQKRFNTTKTNQSYESSPTATATLSSHRTKKKPKLELEVKKIKQEDSTTDEEVSSVFKNIREKSVDVVSNSPTNVPQNQKLMEKQQIVDNVKNVVNAADGMIKNEVDLGVVKVEDNASHMCVSEMTYRETSELVQDTHASFFSLIRDIICSSLLHRMTLERIESYLRSWESNPISPLNDWFSTVDEPWSSLLDSALSFLSADYPAELLPEEFVPYIELKQHIKSYQWIGAGRDSDSHLAILCKHWLNRKDDVYQSTQTEEEPQDEQEESMEEVEDVGSDEVPPSRSVTSWTVRPSLDEEKKSFQEQELIRFENPHKSFTYWLHGYESVVGPVKGIYNTQTSSAVLKARGHNLLTLDRPSYITILALVRDACARLPNGEGTRSDICTLIKDSRYLDLSAAGDNTLQNVVSGALDRLHYEIDSCVKFDSKRKLWIYLHRNRSEAEMERMHQQYQGVSKTAKKPTRKKGGKKTEVQTKDKESVSKEPLEQSKLKKSKQKTNMTMLPKLRNIKGSTRLFTNVTPGGSSGGGVVVNESVVDVEKLPGQSLLNQDTVKPQSPTTSNQIGLTPIMGPVSPQTLHNVRVLKPATTIQSSQQPTVSAAVTANKTSANVIMLQNVLSGQQAMKDGSVTGVAGAGGGGVQKQQEIITSTGKKILIQTSYPGTGVRTPVKFVQANPTQANLISQKILSVAAQGSNKAAGLVMAAAAAAAAQKQTQQQLVQPGSQSPQLKTIGQQPQQQQQQQSQETSLQNLIKAQGGQSKNVLAAQFSGTQFITASGQKVQIIASNQQGIGNLQNLQLAGAAGVLQSQANSTGGLQQVQILTSNGQIITRTIPTSSAGGVDTKNTSGGIISTIRPTVAGNTSGGTVFTKSATSVPTTGTVTVAAKNIRMVVPQNPTTSANTETITKPAVSLLTSNQNKPMERKVETGDHHQQQQQLSASKVNGLQLVQKQHPGSKPTSHVISVSGVQLVGAARSNQGLAKPIINKNNAPILTGVKLVNTQQGVKMVATSSTMVQNPIQQLPKSTTSATITKTASAGQQGQIQQQQQTQQQTQATVGKIQRTPQLITMGGLLQNAGQIRVAGAGGKGSASLIQLPSSSGGVPQFAVVSQGNIISVAGQPRVLTGQHITTVANLNQAQSATATTSSAKPNATPVRVTSAASVNLATLAGKPVLLTSGGKNQGQAPQNVILASPNAGSGQTLVLAPQGNVRAGQSPGTLTVVQQGGGQQILIPSGFQAGTLNLKTFQGVKVIPLSTAGQKGTPGRQQVFARIIKNVEDTTEKINTEEQ